LNGAWRAIHIATPTPSTGAAAETSATLAQTSQPSAQKSSMLHLAPFGLVPLRSV
jgi:hypothetical protein